MARTAEAYDRAVIDAARAYRAADEALRTHTAARATWRDALDSASTSQGRAWRAERTRLVESVARARITLNRVALEA